jgi:DNA-directed RNA polymerase specialized sigma24 family protein
MPTEELPEVAVPAADPADDEASKAAYRILAGLSVDDRVALVLRAVAQMTIAEAAEACGVSTSTLKRRVRRAESAFMDQARREPALQTWLTPENERE